jgi:hypothetical protein
MNSVRTLTRELIFGVKDKSEGLKILENIGTAAHPTEFAVLLNAMSSYWTSGYTDGKPEIITDGGKTKTTAKDNAGICIRPVLDSSRHPQNWQYETVRLKSKSASHWDEDREYKIKVAQYGEYPQRIVEENRARMIITDTASIKASGKKYKIGSTVYDELITNDGKKFVVVKTDKLNLVEIKPLLWFVDEATDTWILRDLPAPVKFNEIEAFCEQFTKDMQPSTVFRRPAQSKKTTFQPNGKRHKNGFVYDTLSNDDLLQMYVRTGIPVFLHGPSGVGKTQRVLKVDPTATRITLRPQMNPEEVDGILDRESRTGEYLPPLWHTQLCRKCENEPNTQHILFIDELTNVKPTVQSLVYSIVLEHAGKDGLWPLPENSVVVAAGNEKAGNLAAFPLTNALFRRFAHIYYDVNVSEWLGWALGEDSVHKQAYHEQDKENRTRVHPAIIGYIAARSEGVLYQDLDEDEPRIVTDPRKWKMASDVLYETQNPKSLLPAIGEELTADFTEFTLSIKLTVEDILEKKYNANECRKMDIGKKFAAVIGLLRCPKQHLPVITDFINDCLGKEVCQTFNELWTLYNKNKGSETENEDGRAV